MAASIGPRGRVASPFFQTSLSKKDLKKKDGTDAKIQILTTTGKLKEGNVCVNQKLSKDQKNILEKQKLFAVMAKQQKCI